MLRSQLLVFVAHLYPDAYCTMVTYSIAQRWRTRNNFCANSSDLPSNNGAKYGIIQDTTFLLHLSRMFIRIHLSLRPLLQPFKKNEPDLKEDAYERQCSRRLF